MLPALQRASETRRRDVRGDAQRGTPHPGAKVAAQSDVFLVVGTSAAGYPAADLPTIAATRGAKIISLNMETIDVDDVAAVVLRGLAEELLPEVIQAERLTP